MLFNPVMEGILESPFHGLISNHTMIIYYTGSKSGKAYHIPVGYRRINNTLLTTSWKDRTWWKNFRDACDVNLLLKGKLVKAQTQVFEDEATIVEGLKNFIGSNPRVARMFTIELQAEGGPDPVSLNKAASLRVLIRTELL
jgi:hypothetical protein